MKDFSTIPTARNAWYGVDPDVFARVSSDHSSCSTSLNMDFKNLPVIKEVGVTSTPSTRPDRTNDGNRTPETMRTTFISSGLPELRPWCQFSIFYRTLGDTDTVNNLQLGE